MFDTAICVDCGHDKFGFGYIQGLEHCLVYKEFDIGWEHSKAQAKVNPLVFLFSGSSLEAPTDVENQELHNNTLPENKPHDSCDSSDNEGSRINWCINEENL